MVISHGKMSMDLTLTCVYGLYGLYILAYTLVLSVHHNKRGINNENSLIHVQPIFYSDQLYR